MRLRRILLVAVLALALPDLARPSPVPLSARVVLVRAARVYLALEDASRIGPRDRITFRWRGRDVAAGEVTRVVDGELALVHLAAGSLDGIHKLDRIDLLTERAALSSRASLRIGYPSAARSSLLFACDQVDFLPSGAYLARNVGEREARAIRDPSVPLAAPWPDTLIARFFDDSNDEEIALERAEIDVAVFWPGELSRHMREQSRWQGHAWGVRARGFVAAQGLGPAGHDSIAVAPDSAALERLDRELFRGDLLRAPDAGLRARPFGPVRFEADLGAPGFRELQRLLDTMAPPTARRARLLVVDQPVSAIDSLRAAAGLDALFLLRCPVVSSPELRPYVDALGPGALVDALECRMRSRSRP
jgi:hypothetical protein